MHEHAYFMHRYINMQIRDVQPTPTGFVLKVAPPGRLGSRRILVEGITRMSELPDLPANPVDDPDWEQQEIDLGDEIAERRRYEEDPCES